MFGAVRLFVGAVDSWPKDMAGGASGHEVMALVEGLAELVDLGFFGGGAQDEVVANEDGLGHPCFHGGLKQERMTSFFSKRQRPSTMANFRATALGQMA